MAPPPARAETVLSDTLADCGAVDAAASLESAVGAFHDGLGAATADPIDAPADGLSEVATQLHEQLAAVVSTHTEFSRAWDAFADGARESGLPRRDPSFRSLLPTYQQSTSALAELVGCGTPKFADGLIPCEGIPVAHGLAVAAEQVHGYLANRYTEAFPQVVALAAELDERAAAFHDLVHAIEFSVPDVQNTFAELTETRAEGGTEPSSGPAFEPLRESFEALDALVGACRDPSELSDSM